MEKRSGWRWVWGFIIVMAVLALLVVGVIFVVDQIVRRTALDAAAPVQQANNALRTQVAQFLNPTPTLAPDPITIIHEIRGLARLETIQYSVEKVITAETNQDTFGFLFGDRLLLVAHGTVIAGVDLAKLQPEDMRVVGSVLYVRLPPAEIFVAALDNEKSYVYDRDTGPLARGTKDLETSARQAAESEILKAALDDGILYQAQVNAEMFLSPLLRDLGFDEVMFEVFGTPHPTPIPAP